MKINDLNAASSSLQNVAKSGSKNDASKVRANAGLDPTTSAAVDQVALSSQSRLFAAAMTAGEASRSSRIDQLRALYVQNQHEADPQDVSNSIIDAHMGRG